MSILTVTGLSIALTFTTAPNSVVECIAWERHSLHHIIGVPGTVDGTSPSVAVPCEASGADMATLEPVPGQVVIFAVRTVDPNTLAHSEWVGGP